MKLKKDNDINYMKGYLFIVLRRNIKKNVLISDNEPIAK